MLKYNWWHNNREARLPSEKVTVSSLHFPVILEQIVINFSTLEWFEFKKKIIWTSAVVYHYKIGLANTLFRS
jgi:hypothetical protein